MNPITIVVAGSVGVITGVVTYRVLRDQGMFGNASLPIAICGSALAAIGLLGSGEGVLFLCIPWAALGFAVLVVCVAAVIMWVLGGLRGVSRHDRRVNERRREKALERRREQERKSHFDQARVIEHKRRK